MIKAHVYRLTCREKTDEAVEKEDDEGYLRRELLSKILYFLKESDFDIDIRYEESVEIVDEGQHELNLDDTQVEQL